MSQPLNAGDVAVRLAADFDARGFQEYDRAIEAAERKDDVAVHLGADVAHRHFDEYDRALKAAESKAKRRDAYKAELGADYNPRAFQAAERAIQKWDREAAKTRDAELKASFDSRGVDQAGRALRQWERDSGRATKSARDLDMGLLSVGTRIPLIKWAAIATGAASIVAPVTALTGALGPVAGLLGAIPGLALAAGATIGSGMLALGGIGNALGAAWEQQTKVAAGTADTANQTSAAADQVAAAEGRLEDAHRDVADAQHDLNEGRDQARQRLVDLRLEAEASNHEEQKGVDALRDARQEVARLQQTGGSGREVRDARRAVRDAEIDLAQTRVDGARARRDHDEAEKSGLRGMDEVVDARRRLADAERRVEDATDDVRKASDKANESMAQAAGGSDQLAESMANLSPAGRAFVALLQDRFFPAARRLREIAQEGMLPGLGDGMVAASRNLPVVERGVDRISRILGRRSRGLGEFLGTDEFGQDLDQLLGQSGRLLDRTGRSAIGYASGLRHVAVAAEPLVGWLGKVNLELSEGFDEWARGGRESGSVERFFRRSADHTELAVEALWDFGHALIDIGAVGSRVWGGDMLRGINDAAERLRDWTESVRGQRDLEEYFTRWRRRWREIGDGIGDIVRRYRQLRREGASSTEALAGALSEAFGKALPKVANQVARAVPHVVKAFITGFLEADVWGRLAISGWLFAKFGGAGAFLGLGSRGGGLFGRGFATTSAAGAAGGFRGGFLARMGRLAPGIGLAVAALLGPEIAKSLERHGDVRTRSGLPGAGGLSNIGSRFLSRQFDLSQLTTGPEILGGLFNDGPAGALREIDESLGLSEEKMRSWAESADRAFRRFRRAGDGAGMHRVADQAREIAKSLDGDARRALLRWANQAESTAAPMRKLQRGFSAMRNGAVLDVEQMERVTTRNMRTIRRELGVNSEDGNRAVRRNFTEGMRVVRRELREGRISTGDSMHAVRGLMKTHSGAGKDALKGNFAEAREFIGKTMRRGGEITERGMKTIRRMMVKELQLYGLSPRQALNISKGDGNGGQFGDPDNNQGREGGAFRASGGYMDSDPLGRVLCAGGGLIGRWGERGRDLVHAVLGRGEAVLNHAQQRIVNAGLSKLGIRGLPELFSRTRGSKHHMAEGGLAGIGGDGASIADYLPHAGAFAAGGQIVPVPGSPGELAARSILDEIAWVKRNFPGLILTDAYGPGHSSPGHTTYGTAADFSGPDGQMDGAVRRLVQMGYLVGYDGRFGSQDWPGHGPSTRTSNYHLHVEFGGDGRISGGAGAGAGPGGVPKIGRIKIGGPDSPLKAMVQRAVDASRAGAQHSLEQATMAMGDGGAGRFAGGISGDGDVERVFANIARRLSDSRVATKALGMAGYAESGMRDLDYGHSTSEGALQLLSSTAAGMGIDPHDEGQVASAFLLRGYWGKGGANDLAAQGLPAHMVAQNAQGSATYDGSNYLAQTGPAEAWMRRFGLAGGGFAGGGEADWTDGVSRRELPGFARAAWRAAERLLPGEGRMPTIGVGGVQKGRYAEYRWPRGLTLFEDGSTGGRPQGSGGIGLTRRMLDALSSPKKRDHDYALKTMLHEFAHARQDYDLDAVEREGGAEQWAQWATPQVMSQIRVPYLDAEVSYPAETAMAARKGRRWWQRDQFRFAGGGFAGGGDGASIADAFPSAGSFAGGGFVGGSGLMTKSGRAFSTKSFKGISSMEAGIEDLGREYELANRRFDLTDEEFVIEGDENTPPSIDQGAVERRVGELNKLIEIRRKTAMKYKRLFDYIDRLLRTYNTMRSRLERSVDQTQKRLSGLEGKKGREARRARSTLSKRLDEYKGTLSGVGERIADLGPRLSDAKYERESTLIDVQELRGERKPLLGGGRGVELPDFEPPEPDDASDGAGDDGVGGDSPEVSPDLEAQLAQSQQREQVLQQANRLAAQAFSVFQGPGDIGAGASSGFEAARNPYGPGGGFGTPGGGMGLALNDQGQVVTTGGQVVDPSVFGQQIHQHFHSPIPATATQLAQIAKAANAGNSLAGYRTSPRERVGP